MGALAAVLWDLDGTLVDSEPVWRRSQVRLAAECGASWSETDGLALVGSSMEVTIDAMQRAGVQLPAQQIRSRLVNDVTDSLKRRVPWRPGAYELVEALCSVGISQAIVTTSPRSMVEVIQEALPAGAVTVIVSCDDVSNRKPHPEPYLAALRALGVEPGSCVAIEDSPAGLASASAAGIAVIGVPNDAELPPGTHWTKVTSLHEVGVPELDRILQQASPAATRITVAPSAGHSMNLDSKECS